MAYIYEYIRTRGFEPLYFEEHYAHLEELARNILYTSLDIDRQELKKNIADTLYRNGFKPNTSHLVKVCYDTEKRVKIVTGEVLYDHFSARAIRPTIGCVERIAKGSTLLENCSVKDAMLELHFAQNAKLDNPNALTIWATEEGEVVAIDGSPIVAVFEDEIRFSPNGGGVEYNLVYKAAMEQFGSVTQAPLLLSELKEAKELLFVDCRGITAIDRWEEHHYMDLTAIVLASQVAKNEH